MPYPKVILKLSVNTFMYFARKVHQFVTSTLKGMNGLVSIPELEKCI